MLKPLAGINPGMLVWARERAGYSVIEAAKALRRPTAELEAWEDGSGAPSYTQLEKLAYKLYKRPIALFFFPEPPEEEEPRHAFRTLPDFEIDALAPNTRLLIRRARALQLSLAELNEGGNPSERLIFRDVVLTSSTSIAQSAQRVRDYLGVSLDDQSKCSGNGEAFKKWRTAVEDAGIFVFKDAFEQGDVSGFCLNDAEFPLIYVSNSTAFARQTFTLFHELAHLLLSTNGITKRDTSYIEALSGNSKAVEVFCNRFAGEVLVPAKHFRQLVGTEPFSDELVEEMAKRYRVSREVVLRRFLETGKITEVIYEKKATEWTDDYKRRRRATGGDYYATHASYLGGRYLRLAFGCYYRGACTVEQLASHLNVSVSSIAGLEQFALQ